MHFKEVTYLGLCLRYNPSPMGGGGTQGVETLEKRGQEVFKKWKKRGGQMVSPRWEAGKKGKKDTTLHNILQ